MAHTFYSKQFGEQPIWLIKLPFKLEPRRQCQTFDSSINKSCHDSCTKDKYQNIDLSWSCIINNGMQFVCKHFSVDNSIHFIKMLQYPHLTIQERAMAIDWLNKWHSNSSSINIMLVTCEACITAKGCHITDYFIYLNIDFDHTMLYSNQVTLSVLFCKLQFL